MTTSESRSSIPTVLAVALGVLLLIQIGLLVALWRTNSEVAELRDDVAALDTAAFPVLDPGDDADAGSAGQSSSGPEATTEGTGDLPRFEGGGADAAVGQTLGDLSGLEYYSGEAVVVAPADGVSRAFMVWAHWCPYCQEELPLMSEWQADNAAALDNFELVSVTTSIDDTASNPLVPYLDGNQFPFPVIVDEDGGLARQLGVNAFPFWVFTAPDGTVVGRAAGAIQAADLDAIFRQLNDLEPTA
jgi:thiol-disulfide isomerase/thioredoxin